MIICLDVGNTNIKYALFEGDKFILSFRVATEHKKTSDEYGGQLISILKNNGVSPKDIVGGIISSVVPPLDYTLERMCFTYLKIKPLVVGAGLKTGMNLKVDNAREVGADRVVNNVAAVKKSCQRHRQASACGDRASRKGHRHQHGDQHAVGYILRLRWSGRIYCKKDQT